MSSRALMVGMLATVLMLAKSDARANVFNMPTGETSMQFVTVGDAGNKADPSTGYGAVPYTYQMGKNDVTIGQYCQFLNAVAKTDTYKLYNSFMMDDYCISRSGSSGNYSYSVTSSDPQAVNWPVCDVNWGDAARYCNWLQNNQPTGAEGAATTETGAYALNGATSPTALTAVARKAGATYFLPSENEWYKAAYYNAANASYWLYTTQSNTAPSNVLSATGTNNANYGRANGETPVGAFAGSPGPYGTYDMGGNVYQWNEAKIDSWSRGMRGGNWADGSDRLASSYRYDDWAATTVDTYGFRVASAAVPEPDSIVFLLAGALAFGIWKLRRNA